MEWFKRKTSIAGYQISNWIIVLGAIIIVLISALASGLSDDVDRNRHKIK